MANSIAIQVYRVEYNPNTYAGTPAYQVILSYPYTLNTDNIAGLVPVNVAGGQDLTGLPYLYSKITEVQFGLEQELFVMNSVLDIQNKWNA